MQTRFLKVEKRKEERERERKKKDILIWSENRLILTVPTLAAHTSTVQTLTLTKRKYQIS